MKPGNNSVEGQMDIFEAMNRAAEAVDRMVEQEHRTKQGKNVKAAPSKPESKEVEPPVQSGKVKRMEGNRMHASMQRTFINTSDDDFATVAYIDYNMVYWKDWNAPASLRCFKTAKEAVDFYVEKLTGFQENLYASPAKEHEPFSDVVQVAEDLFVEEG
ncbi:MAG: hypothetical protein ACI4DO_00860 [Roseburia sp.]